MDSSDRPQNRPWKAILVASGLTAFVGGSMIGIPLMMSGHGDSDEKPNFPKRYVIFTEKEKTQSVDEAINEASPDDLYEHYQYYAAKWIHDEVEQTRKDIGHSDNLHLHVGYKITDYSSNENAFLNAYASPRIVDDNGWEACEVITDRAYMVKKVSQAIFKTVMAHEIEHCYQNPSLTPQQKEEDADLAAAKTYGPKAVIDTFEFFRSYKGNLDIDVTHGSLTTREQRIRDAFPEAKNYKPLPYKPTL